MEPKDLFELIFGLIWGTCMLILWTRNKSKPKIWPPLFGVGGAVYIFIVMMTESLLRGQKSGFLRDTIASFLLSLVFGIVGYLSGRALARRFGKH